MSVGAEGAVGLSSPQFLLPCSRLCATCSVFFSSRRRHTRLQGDWSSDVCSSDLISTDLSKEPAAGGGRGGEENWVKRVQLDGDVTGVYADYKYVGTGDTGGAAQEYTARMLEAMVTRSET